MSEKANFTGSAIGTQLAMTGRLTSIAADSTGLIVVGAASGGLWVSTNNGGSFVSVFDNQPTQADRRDCPRYHHYPQHDLCRHRRRQRLHRLLVRVGDVQVHQPGSTWTPVGPTGTFDRASFTSLAIDTQTTPGKPRIFAGTTSGFSGSSADAGIFESDASKAGLWFSTDGGTSWTQYPESTFGRLRPDWRTEH